MKRRMRMIAEGWLGSQANDAIVTAAFHMRDGDRSAKTSCDAEVVGLMLEG